MNDYDVNAYSDEEVIVRRPKLVRERINHFEMWDHDEFVDRFRLSPQTVMRLVDEVQHDVEHPTDRNDALSAENQVLLTLRYYATGCFLRTAGDFVGVHKSTCSKTIKRVSRAIATLRPDHIYMPHAEEEITVCKEKFFNIARFPKCIGAIDCSHVKIKSPGGPNAETYRNKKQFFSINVQTIADADLKIRNIVARWPGASHDAHIFRNSMIFRSFETGTFGYNGSAVLVGDSGYPIKPYLITPLQNVNNQAENLFNESLIRTRNVVERSYGVWKQRFPGLALGLKLKVETIQAVIVATAILHNIAIDEREILPPVTRHEARAIELINNNIPAPFPQHIRRNGINYITRNNLINDYFARL